MIDIGADRRPRVAARMLARNAVWLVGGDLLARLVALGVAMYLARVLGAAGYGQIGAALGFTSYVLIGVNAGFDPHGSRIVARAPDDIEAVFSQILTARFLLSLGMYAVLGLLVYALPDKAVGGRALALVYGGRLFVQVVDTAWVLRGRDQMSAVTKGVWIREAANAAGVLALVRGPDPMLLLVPAVFVGAETLRVTYCLHAARRGRGRVWRRPRLPALAPMLRESAPLAGSKALRLLFYEGDVLLVTWLATTTEAGYFLVSHKVVLALGVSFGTLYQENIYPTLSRLQASDPDAASRFVERANRLGLAATLPLAIGVSVLSPFIVAMLFGAGFAPSAEVLAVSAFAIPMVLLVAGLNNHLLAAKRTGDVLRSDVLATTVHLGLAMLWIPASGAVAAAGANLAGRLTALVIAAVLAGRLQQRIPFTARAGAVVVAGAVMAALAFLLPIASAIPRLLLASVGYVVCLISLRGVTLEELRRLRSRIRP